MGSRRPGWFDIMVDLVGVSLGRGGSGGCPRGAFWWRGLGSSRDGPWPGPRWGTAIRRRAPPAGRGFELLFADGLFGAAMTSILDRPEQWDGVRGLRGGVVGRRGLISHVRAIGRRLTVAAAGAGCPREAGEEV